MSTSPEFVDYVLEHLVSWGGISTRRMFGCVAFMQNDCMFALISADDRLYVKIDDTTRAHFESEGGQPFTYFSKHKNGEKKEVALSFYTVPDSALDDPDELMVWSRLGLDAAIRNYVTKTKRHKSPL